MQLSINHLTRYTYATPAKGVIQLLRKTPLSFTGQTVLDWRIDVDVDARLREGRDGYGNVTHMLYVDKPVGHLEVSVTGRVLTEDRAGVVQGLPGDLPPQVFCRATPLTVAGPALAALADSIAPGPDPALGRLHRLNQLIYERMTFDTRATGVQTTAEQAAAAGHGVCQDFTHMLIAAARHLLIPARYISGHLYRRDTAQTQEAAHAWAECWVGDLGWVAFDPTNGISADEAYVRVACGLDYRDAAPVVGARSGGGHEELAVEVAVSETAQQA
ncbi:MAG TPA: transglutaminase family protein, partial [Allosphingosinicella sp.]|nr:transglutaminase family protein [Allosphingosinicella sp.]